ncbi:Protein kinase superfamily protein [Rhynchospora pubera]|uniref:non-specific serine/threonine protein kinase n=2 Tax=Rhynchospora pubera TaxID=906938 RepID=A0AAV8AS72_9POAL|nr:Protein kinase superfamily protein [Rhynchospora pubera]
MGNCCFAKITSPESPCLSSNFSEEIGCGSDSSTSRVSDSCSPLSLREEGDILQSANLRSFTFEELKTATRNFQPESMVGEGGFGLVFKGWIHPQTFEPAKPGTGLVIAVKKLKMQGFQGHKEWLAEVNYLGQLSHPNLIKLIGHCLEDEHRLLVYEFMPRGSLEQHLFKRGLIYCPLSWDLRIKIALEASKVLAFLHSDKAGVIYRDFKTSNVLLDLNFNAKLSDFGLAKDSPTGNKSFIFTRIIGTYGYAAPEYLSSGWLTTKSDVYSFGVVLLEILTGRRSMDKNRPSAEYNLVEWAHPHLKSKRKIFGILDPRFEGQYSRRGVLMAAKLARLCLLKEANRRPDMHQVVSVLEKIHKLNNVRMNLMHEL